MVELLTSAQMRAIEAEAIETGQVAGRDLMEWAGRGAVAAMLARWPKFDKTARRAVVLCGPGNNGGDGFVVARHLTEAGWSVELLFWGAVDRLPPDARTNHDLWAAMAKVHPLTLAAAKQGARPELLVDAMFGTGLTRPIPLEMAQAFHAVRGRPKAKGPRRAIHKVVSLDCPSGLNCDTGEFLFPRPPTEDEDEVDGTAHDAWWRNEATPRLLHADLTLTFHAPKVGHYLSEIGRSAPQVVDIGLGAWINDPALLSAPGSDEYVRLIAPEIRPGPARVWIDSATGLRVPGAHKYQRGHVLVLSGGHGKGGAARLAARAALRSGAGLVTLGAPPEAMLENACQLTAIMLREVGTAEALAATLEDARFSSVCLGPGLGVGPVTRAMVAAALAPGDPDQWPPRAVVLDADALTSFAEAPDALFRQCHDRTVLTPHEGEFARLFPDLDQRARHDRRLSKVDVARLAAQRSGAIVLLKGAATVIAHPGGAAAIHPALYDRKAPWLATAGAGDVLAGIIAGLLAPQLVQAPMRAVEMAAWLHVEAARRFGAGLIAEDLPETLPQVYRDLGL